jgi:hydrophobic/amphiphilic exporter-1 (mainly G- bacteria), HAE1 family
MKVLLIEDQEHMVSFIRKGISAEGYEIEIAYDGRTGKYVGLLRVIVSRRWLTFGILLAFGAGIFYENLILPSGFIPNGVQSTIYAIIQTPPGSTLEKTNQVSQRLQKICEEIDGVESVSSLAGYEIMTEG